MLRNQRVENDYVFDGADPKGHIVGIKRQQKKVRDASGVSFSIHDLRRTFLTIAESMDISPYALKRLVNHKAIEKTDVTAGYIVVDIERLRHASQRITNHILQLAGITKEIKIIKLENA